MSRRCPSKGRSTGRHTHLLDDHFQGRSCKGHLIRNVHSLKKIHRESTGK